MAAPVVDSVLITAPADLTEGTDYEWSRRTTNQNSQSTTFVDVPWTLASDGVPANVRNIPAGDGATVYYLLEAAAHDMTQTGGQSEAKLQFDGVDEGSSSFATSTAVVTFSGRTDADIRVWDPAALRTGETWTHIAVAIAKYQHRRSAGSFTAVFNTASIFWIKKTVFDDMITNNKLTFQGTAAVTRKWKLYIEELTSFSPAGGGITMDGITRGIGRNITDDFQRIFVKTMVSEFTCTIVKGTLSGISFGDNPIFVKGTLIKLT